MRRQARKFLQFPPSDSLTDTLKRTKFSPTLELGGDLSPRSPPHGTPMILATCSQLYRWQFRRSFVSICKNRFVHVRKLQCREMKRCFPYKPYTSVYMYMYVYTESVGGSVFLPSPYPLSCKLSWPNFLFKNPPQSQSAHRKSFLNDAIQGLFFWFSPPACSTVKPLEQPYFFKESKHSNAALFLVLSFYFFKTLICPVCSALIQDFPVVGFASRAFHLARSTSVEWRHAAVKRCRAQQGAHSAGAAQRASVEREWRQSAGSGIWWAGNERHKNTAYTSSLTTSRFITRNLKRSSELVSEAATLRHSPVFWFQLSAAAARFSVVVCRHGSACQLLRPAPAASHVAAVRSRKRIIPQQVRALHSFLFQLKQMCVC